MLMINTALPSTRSVMMYLVVVLLLHGSVQAARAQTRTYVSGTGYDGNPCTVSQPCRTLQKAVTATAAGGEIYVLNSADYSPVTINKSVTITSEGAVAGVRA